MNQELELKVMSWIDGELSASEAKQFAATVAADTELSALATELRLMKTALAGNELELKVPETREFYWSKISREIERQERSTAKPVEVSWVAHLRRMFVPLAGIAAVVVVSILSVDQPSAALTSDSHAVSGEMETVTFRDQASGMTVVWLQDRDDAQSDDTSKVETQ